MAKNTSNSKSKPLNQKQLANIPFHKHHYFRTIVASFFGFLALNLIIASILVFWLSKTLTDTNTYVATVSPLVSKPEVQNFVSDKVASSILDNKDIPLQDLATQVLGAPAVVGKTPEQLKSELAPVIKDSVKQIVASPNFANLWATTNRNAHQQFLAALKQKGVDVTLDLHPVIVGVLNELGKTKLASVKDKLQIKDDAGKVTIKGHSLDKARNIYDIFRKLLLPIVLAALVFATLSILISVHHLKTLRRITFSTGITTGLLAIALKAVSFIKISGSNSSDQQVAKTVALTLLHNLYMMLVVISVVCLVIAIGSKIYSVMKARSAKPAANLKNFR